MTGKGHRAMGVLGMIFTYHLVQGSAIIPIYCAVGVMLGANAPDYLELRTKRGTLIAHRTITHWLPLWGALLWWALGQLLIVPVPEVAMINIETGVASLIAGFALGGLLHLLMDLPNPMGIPILTPLHRWSLNWWRSGNGEGFILGGTIVGLSVYLYSFYQLGNIVFN